jgi:hypothetical protein
MAQRLPNLDTYGPDIYAPGNEALYEREMIRREQERDAIRRLDERMMRLAYEQLMAPPKGPGVRPGRFWYDRDDAGKMPEAVWIDLDKFKAEAPWRQEYDALPAPPVEEEPTDAELWKSGVEGIYPRAWQFRLECLDYELVFPDGSVLHVPVIAFMYENGDVKVTRP